MQKKYPALRCLAALCGTVLLGCTTPVSDISGNGSVASTLPDAKGNIYVDNRSSSALLVYYENNAAPRLLKEVPAAADPEKSSPFLIEVPTDGNESKVLKIWQKDKVAVQGDPGDKPYRQWTVVLSKDMTSEDARFVWMVTGGISGGTGSVSFSYDKLMTNNTDNNYSVDVFLNSKTGSKITSIAPGTKGKRIGLEYNTYHLFFRYWFSNPDFYNGEVREIGWTEYSTDVVLNVLFNESAVKVPCYWSDVGRVAAIDICNTSSNTIVAYANNELIEKFVVQSGSTTNLSTVPQNRTSPLTLLQGSYRFEAKRTSDNTSVSVLSQINLLSMYKYTWNVGSATDNINVSIANSSGKMISVHNNADGSYLGYVIKPGETRLIPVPAAVSKLRFVDIETLAYGKVADRTGGSISISSLDTADFIGPGPATDFASAADIGIVKLTWTPPRDLDYDHVVVVRSAAASPTSANDANALRVYAGSLLTYSDTGLLSGQKYYYAIYAYDKNGNESASAAKTEATPLIPTDVTNLTVSADSRKVTIAWTNPTGSWFQKTVLVRNTTRTPVSLTDGEQAYSGIDNAFSDTNVWNGTLYYYKLFVKDQAGNTSSGIAFQETPNPDTTAPAVATGLTVTGLTQGIKLKWTNPLDSDFQGVSVIRKAGSAPASYTDGTEVYRGASATYSDAATTAATTYYYSVFAFDEVPNYSAAAAVTGIFNPSQQKNGTISTAGGSTTMSFAIPEDATAVTLTLSMAGDFRYTSSEYVTIAINSVALGSASTGYADTTLRIPTGWSDKALGSSSWTAGATMDVKLTTTSAVSASPSFQVTIKCSK